MFEKLDLNRLYDTESDYAKEYIFEPLTDEMIKRAEAGIGYKFPKSYIELLKYQNGGAVDCELSEECWISVIYGIGKVADAGYGLENMFNNWIDEWQYPNIGIPFGETETAGHDMYFMDMRNISENGEPAVVRVENEGGPEDIKIFKIADNLEEFIEMVLEGKNIYLGELIDSNLSN